MRRIAWIAFGLSLVAFGGPSAWAECRCDIAANRMVCDPNYWGDDAFELGDEYYVNFACANHQRHANKFEFTSTWDGFGRTDGWIVNGQATGCSAYLPYGRTLNGLSVLAELAWVGASRINDYYSFAAREINQTNAFCWKDRNPNDQYTDAEAKRSWPEDWVNIYTPFFKENVVDRAAVVVHEARHIYHYSLWAQPAEHVDCDRGPQACDWQFSNTRDLSDAAAGGYSLEVWVLEEFARVDTLAPRFLRDHAVQSANVLLQEAFLSPTGYRIPRIPTEGCPAGSINPSEGRPGDCWQCESGLANQRVNFCLPPCGPGMTPNAERDGCHGHLGAAGGCPAGNECESGLSCLAGRCVPPGGFPNGSSCSANIQCFSNFCDSGSCRRPDPGRPLECDEICHRKDNTGKCIASEVRCHEPR